jgi:hypothetical protein
MSELLTAAPQAEFPLAQALKAAKVTEPMAERWLPVREPLEPKQEPLKSRERKPV